MRAAGTKPVVAIGDVSDAKFCEELVETTVRELGSIDILVNNAGIIRRQPAAEFSAKNWSDVIEINLNAVFRFCQFAGRHMLAQGSGKTSTSPRCCPSRAAFWCPPMPRPRALLPS